MKKMLNSFFLMIAITGSLSFIEAGTECKNGVCSFDPNAVASSKSVAKPMAHDSVIELTTNNFESFIKESTKPVVVDFYASWCGPCKHMKPVMQSLAKSNSDYIFASVDGEKYPAIMSKYGVRSYPTFVVFKDGKVAGRFVGAKSQQEFLNEIKRIVSR